jgi:hypothetical protein
MTTSCVFQRRMVDTDGPPARTDRRNGMRPTWKDHVYELHRKASTVFFLCAQPESEGWTRQALCCSYQQHRLSNRKLGCSLPTSCRSSRRVVVVACVFGLLSPLLSKKYLSSLLSPEINSVIGGINIASSSDNRRKRVQ